MALLRAFSALAVLALSLPLAAQSPSYKDNPEFQKKWAEAGQVGKKSDPTFAIDFYWKAFKISNGECMECLTQIMHFGLIAGDHGQVRKAANLIEQSSAATPSEKVSAKVTRVLLMLRGRHKTETMTEALSTLQEAIALDSKNEKIFYLQGKVLAEMKRNDEAANAFREYLKLAPARDALRTRVAKFVDDPSLSLRNMAPPFALTTLDGKRFNLDAMDGRVVLIDFWATWCGPCNEELPHMKRLAAQFKDEPFVLLSVSWDSNEAAWKGFISKNEMTWSQFRDSTHQLSRVFGVDAIPHYFTIDSDGVLQAENVGSGSDIDGRIRRLVAKAKKDAAARHTSSEMTGQ
ncbi:MAG: redoxin domain-containing protein [Acidobacteria bacterium]|nr:redoxin domain-containing protein [Acidobacteriota bacterium]